MTCPKCGHTMTPCYRPTINMKTGRVHVKTRFECMKCWAKAREQKAAERLCCSTVENTVSR